MSKFKGDRKKLSKVYRLKKKTGQIKKPDVKTPQPPTRIFVRNISFKATEKDIKTLFSPFGEISEINLLKKPDGTFVGCGFVQFKTEEDASKAIFQTNKKEFFGRPLSCSWAVSKSRYSEQIQTEKGDSEETKKPTQKSKDLSKTEDHIDELKDEPEEKEASVVGDDEVQELKRITKKEKKEKKQGKREKKKLTPEERKAQKALKRKKRAKIIVRNVPFKATKENIKEFFSPYGTIEDVQIPKKPDGKKSGYCFVQFEKVNSAAKAIHYANLKEFMDRSIVVDWALAKKTFEEKVKTEVPEIEIKEEDEEGGEKPNKSAETVEIKQEPESDEEENSDSEDDEDVKKESSSEDEEESEEEDEETDDEETEDTKDNIIKTEFDGEQRSKRFSNDIDEEKTVFIKNVPFRTTNEDLKQCMEQFGPVFYALICMDKLTEHSKGTAFVKFRHVEDAKRCLEAGTELQLLGQVLDPHPALSRQQITEKAKDKSDSKKSKDSRNLYLIREGVVLAGSPAAQNVSAADMAKRLKIEQWKSQILRNLNMFVSRVRIVVHNLPPTLTDPELKTIVKKYAPKEAIITETRIMKNDRGIGSSKEYGFVAFTKHEDALHTLRMMNNNPNIFSVHRRPIVSFSIENRQMVNAKIGRLEKSRKNNPRCPDYVPPKEPEKEEPKEPVKNNKRKALPKNNKKQGPPTKKKKAFKKQ